MRINGTKKNSKSILARKFMRPDLRAGFTEMRSTAERSSLISGLSAGASASADAMAVSVTWEAAEDAACGFETMIMCVHTRHLNRAATPFIFEESIRYFFPHSSQMTIMAELLYNR
jgi:hypothetical protein